MTKIFHSIQFQEQALSKVRERGPRSVQDVANDLNMSVGTLRKWISKSNQKTAGNTHSAQLPQNLPALSWLPAQRLQALLETHALLPAQLSAWCREKGLFEHQLQSWRDAFCTASESRESKAALRVLQVKHEGLQRELRRKEKALAEAAALLVLQKKFHALWEGEEK